MFGQRPVIFYTNGYEHWIWDDAAATRRARCRASTPRDELELLIQRRTTRMPLADAAINTADRRAATTSTGRSAPIGEAFEPTSSARRCW